MYVVTVAIGSRLWTVDYGLRAVDYRLRTAIYVLGYCGLWSLCCILGAMYVVTP